jgi:O-antigen ligase
MAGAYSLVQWIFGIEKTAITGLTVAIGDNIRNKPIGWGTYGMEAIKMPSTYQNGNGAGIFFALIIVVVLSWIPSSRSWKNIRLLSILMATIGLSLCGSRSILYPFMILGLFILGSHIKKLPKRVKNNIALLTPFIILSVSIVIFANQEFTSYFINRNIMQFIENPTASGRSFQLMAFLDDISRKDLFELIRMILIGDPHNISMAIEGILYVFTRYGIIAFSTFLMLLLGPVIKIYYFNKPVAFAMLCVIIAFAVDSTYQYPPMLMNYFLIVGFIIKNRETYVSMHSEEVLK